jgi:hypothetical protein
MNETESFEFYFELTRLIFQEEFGRLIIDLFGK